MINSPAPDYGEKFQLIAKALNHTTRSFAKELGIAASTLNNYYQGVMPPVDIMRRVLHIAPNLNLMWFYFDRGDMFSEDVQKREADALKRENELYRKLEAERDANMKLDPKEIMDALRRGHTMVSSLEKVIAQMAGDMALMKEKLAISG